MCSAFLRGLDFKEVNRVCQALGTTPPISARSVTITAPGNALPHLWNAGFLEDFAWSAERRVLEAGQVAAIAGELSAEVFVIRDGSSAGAWRPLISCSSAQQRVWQPNELSQ